MPVLQHSNTLVITVDIVLIGLAFGAIAYFNHEWLFKFPAENRSVDIYGLLPPLRYSILSREQQKACPAALDLSGYALNKAFAPAIATQVLHGGYFLVSCIGVYLASNKLLGRNVALLIGLFCLFCTEQWGPGGWDYHDVAGGAFYVFTFVALHYAAEREHSSIFSFLSRGASSLD